MRPDAGKGIPRRSLPAVAVASTVGLLGACRPRARVHLVEDPPASTVLPDRDAARTALALSTALFTGADVFTLATRRSLEELAPMSAKHGIPLLIGTGRGVRDELDRLGVSTIVTAKGTDLDAAGADRTVIEVDPAAKDPAQDLPEVVGRGDEVPMTLLVDPHRTGAAQTAARALAEVAGGAVLEVPHGEPRASSDSVSAVTEAAGKDPSRGMVALGASFGPADRWTDVLHMVQTAPELPGGGQSVFPGRRMIAAYGSPGVPALGILGEQGLKESIQRAKQLAKDYAPLMKEPVVPAFELITTLASSQPGQDGDYSSELAPDAIREWIDAAGKAGIYVVLDLQPGRTDFLTQARRYESLLTEPHVGLALDSEWRLKPGQKHLEQIGSVGAEEINETASWLSDLTARHELPQKLLILHQFSRSMITDRADVDTSHPELAITVHADGHGTPELKRETWNALRRDLPAGMFLAWKNFYDEDSPMLTPEQTFAVRPRPWFVSYQ